MSRSIFLVGLLYILGSCSTEQSSSIEDNVNKSYFDLEAFIQDKISSYNANMVSLKKEVVFNSSSEEQQLDSVSWENVLRPFIEADLNKPGWNSGYAIDSLLTGQLLKITYTALEPRLPIRKQMVALNLKDHTPAHIYFEKNTDNSIYTSGQKFSFYPDSLFIIEGTQKAKLLGENQYKVLGKILP